MDTIQNDAARSAAKISMDTVGTREEMILEHPPDSSEDSYFEIPSGKKPLQWTHYGERTMASLTPDHSGVLGITWENRKIPWEVPDRLHVKLQSVCQKFPWNFPTDVQHKVTHIILLRACGEIPWNFPTSAKKIKLV